MRMLSVKLIIIAMIIGIIVIGCGADSGSPSSVVRKYYAALEKEDAKALGEVMTPEGASNLSIFMSKAKDHVTALGKVTNVEEFIDGDSGVVKVTFSNGATEEIDVKKIDGKWKVSEWEEIW